MTLSYDSIKKLGRTFRLQKEFLKTEMDHDEKDGDNYKDKKMNGCHMLKMIFYVPLFVMQGIVSNGRNHWI